MNEHVTADRQRNSSPGGFLTDLLYTGLVVLLIVLPIRLFVAQPFIVSGASMQPTFSTGDYLLIDQLTYNFNPPQREDVVVFRYPNDPSKFFIKRIIGLPGETVKVTSSSTTIMNDEHPDGFSLEEPYTLPDDTGRNQVSEKLDDDEYFVLGDNRNSSSDSRTWGALSDEYLVGRAYLQLFPFDRISLTPGYNPASGPNYDPAAQTP